MLFPVIAGARMWQRLSTGERAGADHRHELAMPPAAINAILRRVLPPSERYLVGTARIPFGVFSLIVLARPRSRRASLVRGTSDLIRSGAN